MRQVELQHVFADPARPSLWARQARRPAPHRPPPKRRTRRTRPALRRSVRVDSGTGADGGSEAIGIAACCGAAFGGAGAAVRDGARGIMRLAVSVATISTPWLPSGKSSREQPQVMSMPGAAPKPRKRSIRMAPLAGNWLASRAAWRRCGSAGPKFLAASSVLSLAPNTAARRGLAHRMRLPSADHSHAGRALAACPARRGSRSTCPWNSAGFIDLELARAG